VTFESRRISKEPFDMRTRHATVLVSLIAASTLFTVLHAQPTAPRDELLLVVTQGDQGLALFKVDGKTLTPAGSVPIGKAREACLTPDGSRAYVTNDGDGSVTVVDIDARKALATVSLPGVKRPDGCAVTPDGKKVYIAGMDSGNVATLSTATNTVLKTFPASKEPRRFVFTAGGRRVYVTSEDAKTITILDVATDRIVGSFQSGGKGPRTLVPLPDKKTLLVANVDSDSVSLLDAATKKVEVTLGSGMSPQRVEISRDGAWAYVLSVMESKLSVIGLKEEDVRTRKFVRLDSGGYGMTQSGDGSLLFVSCTGGNEVVAFETSAIDALRRNSPLTDLAPAVKLQISKPFSVLIRPGK
jgi:YVTN family beta-propeller protein